MNDKIDISIDQLSFSLPIEIDVLKTIGFVKNILRLDLILGKPEKAKAKNGYTDSLVWGSHLVGGIVTLMYREQDFRMGVFVTFTAGGKKLYESTAESMRINVLWTQILHKIYEKGGHLTRLDVAVDYFNENISLNEVNKEINSKGLSFFNARNQPIDDKLISTIGKPNDIQTIYIGKRTSYSFLRLYNKKEEQIETKGLYKTLAQSLNSWIRIEGEFKHDFVHEIGEKISKIPESTLQATLARIMVEKWRIADSNGEVPAWWQKVEELTKDAPEIGNMLKLNEQPLERAIEYYLQGGATSFLWKSK